MASLFGALAQSAGQGIQENVAANREAKAAEAERMHDMQLNNMRMKHERELQSTSLESQEKLDRRRREAEAIQQDVMISSQENLQKSRQTHESALAQSRIAHESNLADKEYDYREGSDKLRSDTDLMVAAMQLYMTETRSGSISGKEWSTTVEESFDPETGAMSKEIFAEKNGITYRQMGDKFVEAGQPVDIRAPESVDKQREAEAELYNGTVTDEEFKDVFGYLPAKYVVSQAAVGSDFGSWATRRRIPTPFLIGSPTSTSERQKQEESEEPAPLPQSRRREQSRAQSASAAEPTPTPAAQPAPTPVAPPAQQGGALSQGRSQSEREPWVNESGRVDIPIYDAIKNAWDKFGEMPDKPRLNPGSAQ